MENNSTLENSIEDILNKAITEKMPEIINQSIEKAIQDAVEDSLKWGNARNVIKKKLDELLVPAIESINVSKYNLKLELLLEQLLQDTTVDDTKQLLSHYYGLIKEEPEHTINMSTILEAYAKHCAEEFECDDRDADAESETYAPFNVTADLEIESRWSSSMNDAILHLNIEDEDDDNNNAEKLAIDLKLWRVNSDPMDEWRPIMLRTFTLNDIKNMSNLEIMFAKLCQNHVKVVNDLNSDNNLIEVTPEETPEWTLA
jgi:hypothetical protein